MTTANNCLSTEQVNLFLDGQLSAEIDGSIIEHLDRCPDCRRVLEESAGSGEWMGNVQKFLSDTETPSMGDVADQGISRCVGSDLDLTGEIATYVQPALLADRLSFLAPSDDPRMLGRMGVYEVSGVIGYGSMGVVLKAWEPSLSRYVALKVLWPHLAINGAARQRFARESRAAAAVVHEHVVPIYAVDEFQGLPYIVLRYVPGRSLQDRINRNGPLQVDEVLRIGRQIAMALDAAHSQGLVHRDVKPANILLENGIERVLVTDFGLARAADDVSLTHSGMVAGTPQFMAPEQAQGESVDHRSDLFSFGSVMYTMCAGHPPFRAETLVGVIHRICQSKSRPLREINPKVPEWLAAFIERLMSKESQKRFQSAAEVAEILEAELAHLQNPVTFKHPDRRWAIGHLRRQRTYVAAGLIVILLVFLAYPLRQWLDQNSQSETNSQSRESQSLLAADLESSSDAWRGRANSAEFLDLWNALDRREHELSTSPFRGPSIILELKEMQFSMQSLEDDLYMEMSHWSTVDPNVELEWDD